MKLEDTNPNPMPGQRSTEVILETEMPEIKEKLDALDKKISECESKLFLLKEEKQALFNEMLTPHDYTQN